MGFWARFSRACLIYPLDSATNTMMGKSNQLSTDLQKYIMHLNKSGMSFWAISKQLQVPRSTVRKIVVYKVHGTVSLPRSGRKHNYHLLWWENWSGWLRVTKQKSISVTSWKLLEDRCQCPQSSVFSITMGWEAAMQDTSPCSRRSTSKLDRSLLLITWTKKKNIWRKTLQSDETKNLATMTNIMFGGEKMRPLTTRTP